MALGGWPLAQAAVAPRLRVVTAHLPPLVVENGGKRPGALHEVVVELCLGSGPGPGARIPALEARHRGGLSTTPKQRRSFR
ncbi:hypothetical protein LP419_35705 [Massilia sp. H-1]|nr:hypothetical protein LP419_35705 [Massilia sp. H-1]